jgi:oxygen-dependent protoporphyrinogen oxidase
VAIVGGGLSGLTAAFRLGEICQAAARPLDLHVFEGSNQCGGIIRTERIDDYLVELGADSFITNKPWAVDLCRRLGLEDELIGTDERFRRSWVLRAGRPVPVPEGFMLLSPAKIRPVLFSPLFTPWGKLRMGLEYFLPRKTDGTDESLASFVRRRFGREALERLVQPLVGGIYTSDPEKLSLKATMPRFLDMEREYRSLIRASRLQARKQGEAERQDSGARYSLFLTLAGGLGELLVRLEQRVREYGKIHLGTGVSEVGRKSGNSSPGSDGTWELTLADGSRQTFDAVIVTTPAHRAAELLSSSSAELAGALRQIEYASSAVVVSGHRLEQIASPLDAFGLVIPHAERRKILAVSFSSRKFPGRAPDGHVILRTFVGGALQPELCELDDEELRALVAEELQSTLGVSGEPEFVRVARYRNAMPQYYVGHLDLVSAIEKATDELVGLELAGSAYSGVGIPDCIKTAQSAAERLLADSGA